MSISTELIKRGDLIEVEANVPLTLFVDKEKSSICYILLHGKASGTTKEDDDALEIFKGNSFGQIQVPTYLLPVKEIREHKTSEYSHVTVTGPAELIVLSTKTIQSQLEAAVVLLARGNLLQVMGFEMFHDVYEMKTFLPGSVLLQEKDSKSHLYIIAKGECKAVVGHLELAILGVQVRRLLTR